jgi:hypothetical protein
MDIQQFYSTIRENFCKGGTTDDNGIYRPWSSGNVIYLANAKGGWAFFCPLVRNDDSIDISRFSIRSNGTYKNEGKLCNATEKDIIRALSSATKYAIITPQENLQSETSALSLKWVEIDENRSRANTAIHNKKNQGCIDRD